MEHTISEDSEITLFSKIKETGSKGFLYSLGAFFQRSTSILLLPVYAFYLHTEEYGAYSLLITTLYFMDTLFSFGIRAGFTRSYYDYNSRKALDGLISTVFWFTIGMSAIVILLGILISNNIILIIFGSTDYRDAFLIVIFLLFIGLFNQLGLTLIRARRAAKSYVLIQTITALVRIGLILWFVIGLEGRIIAILLAYSISAIILLGILIIYLQPSIGFQFSLKETRKMLDFGFPLMIAGLWGFISTYIDRYMLNYYTTLTEVGIYTLAYQIAMVISLIIIYPFKFIWAPTYLSIKEHSFINEFCAKILTYLLLVGGFLALFISLFAGDFIDGFTRPEYRAAQPLIPILVFTYFLWSSRPVIEVAMVLQRKTKFIAVLHLFGAILNIVLNIVLIPRYHLVGAALATALSFSTVLIIDYVYNQSLRRICYEWDRILKILIIIAVLYLLGGFIHFNETVYSFTFRCLLLLAYPILFYLFRFFHREEVEYLNKLFDQWRLKFKGRDK
jgi:O-antigen/teichoic acid export membrane protein